MRIFINGDYYDLLVLSSFEASGAFAKKNNLSDSTLSSLGLITSLSFSCKVYKNRTVRMTENLVHKKSPWRWVHRGRRSSDHRNVKVLLSGVDETKVEIERNLE